MWGELKKWTPLNIYVSPITLSTLTSLWGQHCDLGLLQLLRSRLSNSMARNNVVSWLYTEWPGHAIKWSCRGFFFRPWGILLGQIPRSAMPTFTIWVTAWFREQEKKNLFHTWVDLHRNLYPTESLSDGLDKATCARNILDLRFYTVKHNSFHLVCYMYFYLCAQSSI